MTWAIPLVITATIAFHQPADVEVVGVEKRRDRDPEHVGRRKVLGQRTGEELRGDLRDVGMRRRCVLSVSIRRAAIPGSFAEIGATGSSFGRNSRRAAAELPRYCSISLPRAAG